MTNNTNETTNLESENPQELTSSNEIILKELGIKKHSNNFEYYYLEKYKIYQNVLNGDLQYLNGSLHHYRIAGVEDKEDLNHFIQLISRLAHEKYYNFQLLKNAVNVLKIKYPKYYTFLKSFLEIRISDNVAQLRESVSNQIVDITYKGN